jgi:RNA polymerase sigma-70 factor (ECF subfamily)
VSEIAGQVSASLELVVEKHYDDLLLFIGRRCGSDVVAEEIVQETWVRAKNAPVTIPENPRAYVFRIARNLLADHYRRHHNSPETFGRLTHLSVPSTHEGLPGIVEIDQAPSQEDVAAAQQELRIISQTVEALPAKCRQVFLMYRGEELSMREISERLDVSVKTVENHIRKAMLECRRSLQKAHADN